MAYLIAARAGLVTASATYLRGYAKDADMQLVDSDLMVRAATRIERTRQNSLRDDGVQQTGVIARAKSSWHEAHAIANDGFFCCLWPPFDRLQLQWAYKLVDLRPCKQKQHRRTVYKNLIAEKLWSWRRDSNTRLPPLQGAGVAGGLGADGGTRTRTLIEKQIFLPLRLSPPPLGVRGLDCPFAMAFRPIGAARPVSTPSLLQGFGSGLAWGIEPVSVPRL